MKGQVIVMMTMVVRLCRWLVTFPETTTIVRPILVVYWW